MATLNDHGGLPPVADGVVEVKELDGKWEGWVRVSIGRSRYTKRFNLSGAEAVLLAALLQDRFPRALRPSHAGPPPPPVGEPPA